ncbi:hypothetical protein RCL1_003291 [Eukaryota sp. TZLM3-RCL]
MSSTLFGHSCIHVNLVKEFPELYINRFGDFLNVTSCHSSTHVVCISDNDVSMYKIEDSSLEFCSPLSSLFSFDFFSIGSRAEKYAAQLHVKCFSLDHFIALALTTCHTDNSPCTCSFAPTLAQDTGILYIDLVHDIRKYFPVVNMSTCFLVPNTYAAPIFIVFSNDNSATLLDLTDLRTELISNPCSTAPSEPVFFSASVNLTMAVFFVNSSINVLSVKYDLCNVIDKTVFQPSSSIQVVGVSVCKENITSRILLTVLEANYHVHLYELSLNLTPVLLSSMSITPYLSSVSNLHIHTLWKNHITIFFATGGGVYAWTVESDGNMVSEPQDLSVLFPSNSCILGLFTTSVGFFTLIFLDGRVFFVNDDIVDCLENQENLYKQVWSFANSHLSSTVTSYHQSIFGTLVLGHALSHPQWIAPHLPHFPTGSRLFLRGMCEESHEFLTWPVEIETSDSLIGTYTVLVLGINPIQRHVVTAQQLLPLMHVPSLPDLPFNTVNFCNAFQLLIEYNKRAMTKHLNVFQDSDQSIISLMPSFVALQAPITSRERATSHQSRITLPVCQFIQRLSSSASLLLLTACPSLTVNYFSQFHSLGFYYLSSSTIVTLRKAYLFRKYSSLYPLPPTSLLAACFDDLVFSSSKSLVDNEEREAEERVLLIPKPYHVYSATSVPSQVRGLPGAFLRHGEQPGLYLTAKSSEFSTSFDAFTDIEVIPSTSCPSFYVYFPPPPVLSATSESRALSIPSSLAGVPLSAAFTSVFDIFSVVSSFYFGPGLPRRKFHYSSSGVFNFIKRITIVDTFISFRSIFRILSSPQLQDLAVIFCVLGAGSCDFVVPECRVFCLNLTGTVAGFDFFKIFSNFPNLRRFTSTPLVLYSDLHYSLEFLASCSTLHCVDVEFLKPNFPSRTSIHEVVYSIPNVFIRNIPNCVHDPDLLHTFLSNHKAKSLTLRTFTSDLAFAENTSIESINLDAKEKKLNGLYTIESVKLDCFGVDTNVFCFVDSIDGHLTKLKVFHIWDSNIQPEVFSKFVDKAINLESLVFSCRLIESNSVFQAISSLCHLSSLHVLPCRTGPFYSCSFYFINNCSLLSSDSFPRLHNLGLWDISGFVEGSLQMETLCESFQQLTLDKLTCFSTFLNTRNFSSLYFISSLFLSSYSSLFIPEMFVSSLQNSFSHKTTTPFLLYIPSVIVQELSHAIARRNLDQSKIRLIVCDAFDTAALDSCFFFG